MVDANSVSASDFKQRMYSQLKDCGILAATKTQMRAHMLSQLRKHAQPSSGAPGSRSMLHRALDAIIAEYLAATQCRYTLSIFRPEVGLDDFPPLSHDELLQILQIRPDSPLHRLIRQAQQAAVDREPRGASPAGVLAAAKPQRAVHPPQEQQPCLALSLVAAMSALGERTALCEAGTQTEAADPGRLQLALHRVEQSYLDGRDREAAAPFEQLQSRLAAMQRACEERARLQVEFQVERIREVEVGQAKLQEAARWRKEIENERAELERLYSGRARRLQEQEEALMSRVREQQRDLEGAAFSHRQRLLQEDERLRAWHHERERDLQTRLDALAAREAATEAKELRSAERDADVDRRVAAAEARAADAEIEARKRIELEYAAANAELRARRSAFEEERARVMRVREEASAIAVAAAEKDARLHRLMASAAEAEARAAAHASSEAAYQAHASQLLAELAALRADLGLRARSDIGAADAALGDAAAVMRMLRNEVTTLRSARDDVSTTLAARTRSTEEAAALRGELDRCRAAHAAAMERALLLQDQVDRLAAGLRETQALLEGALAGRERAVHAAAEARVSLRRAAEDAAESERQLKALRAQARGGEVLLHGLRGGASVRSVGAASARTARMHSSPTASRPVSPVDVMSVKGTSFASQDASRVPEFTASSPVLATQRLAQLELEEAEIQEEFKLFQDKVRRQQARLRDDLQRVTNAAPPQGCLFRGAPPSLQASELLLDQGLQDVVDDFGLSTRLETLAGHVARPVEWSSAAALCTLPLEQPSALGHEGDAGECGGDMVAAHSDPPPTESVPSGATAVGAATVTAAAAADRGPSATGEWDAGGPDAHALLDDFAMTASGGAELSVVPEDSQIESESRSILGRSSSVVSAAAEGANPSSYGGGDAGERREQLRSSSDAAGDLAAHGSARPAASGAETDSFLSRDDATISHFAGADAAAAAGAAAAEGDINPSVDDAACSENAECDAEEQSGPILGGEVHLPGVGDGRAEVHQPGFGDGRVDSASIRPVEADVNQSRHADRYSLQQTYSGNEADGDEVASMSDAVIDTWEGSESQDGGTACTQTESLPSELSIEL